MIAATAASAALHKLKLFISSDISSPAGLWGPVAISFAIT